MTLSANPQPTVKGVFVLHIFQRRKLEAFCKKHGIDVQEIDSNLSYEENLFHLKALAPLTVEEISEVWSRTLKDMEENVSLSDIYGPVNAENVEPLIFVKIWLRISRNMLKILRLRLNSFSKNVRYVLKNYVVIEGSFEEVHTILGRIEDLKPKILRKSLKHSYQYAYLPGIGWTVNPS